MKSTLIFPFKVEDDNNKAFAFTLELAGKSNANIIALTSLDLGWKRLDDADNIDELIDERKDEIYCNLLKMKGYYHGRYNQWNVFDKVKVHVNICTNDINGEICSAIDDYENPIVVIQHRCFSGSGLCEEILSNPFLSDASIFILPCHSEFEEPSHDLIGILFHNQKRLTFGKILNETKMFDLPDDYHDFREYMIIQEAV